MNRLFARLSLWTALCLVSFFAPATQAAWQRLSGPTPPPVSEFVQHDGRWFMGTEYADQGAVFYSDDGGLSWTDAGLPNGGVSSALSHQGRLFMGTYLGGLHYTDDGGGTWQPVAGTMGQSHTVEALIALDDNTLLAGLDQFFPVPLQRSLDGGLTWDEIAGAPSLRCFDLIELAGVILAGGEDQGVWRSSDGGNTWAAANTGLPEMADAHRFTAQGSTLFLAAESVSVPLAVYRSDDLGLSWQAIASDLPPLLGQDAGFLGVLAGNLYLGTTGFTGTRGLYRSADSGETWTRVTSGLPEESGFRAVTFMDGDLLIGGMDGAFRSSDAGQTWADSWFGSAGPCGSQTAHWTGERLLVGNDSQGQSRQGLHHTADLGTAWIPATGSAVQGEAYAFCQEGTTVWAAMYGFPRGVLVSEDGGQSFTGPGTGMPSGVIILDLLRLDGELWAGTWTGLYRSSDDGLSWQADANLGAVYALVDLAGDIYAGLYPGGVHRSVDGGNSWTHLATGMGTDVRVNDLAVFQGQVYAALNSGLIQRWDGNSWITTGYDGGIPNVLLAVDGALLAGTPANRVLVSSDGQTWEDFSTGYFGGITEGLALTEDHVLAISRNQGYWLRPRAELPGNPSALAEEMPVAGANLKAAPNPFNPRTRLYFDLETEGAVRVDIHDPAGRRMRTLVQGRLAAGPHAVPWDGRDDQGRACASGLYLARVSTPGHSATAKLVLVR